MSKALLNIRELATEVVAATFDKTSEVARTEAEKIIWEHLSTPLRVLYYMRKAQKAYKKDRNNKDALKYAQRQTAILDNILKNLEKQKRELKIPNF